MLHLPYTMMVLSFVIVGATIAPVLSWPVLVLTLVAYLLALGVGAHFLDQLPGMGSRYIRNWTNPALWGVGIAGVGAGVAIGLVGAVVLREPWLVGFVALEGICALGYPLAPVFRGVLHRDSVFVFAWGSLPCLTSFYAQSGMLSPLALLMAAGVAAISFAEIRTSRASRESRRRARFAEPGGPRAVTSSRMDYQAHDRVLQVLSIGTTALSCGLVLGRAVLGG